MTLPEQLEARARENATRRGRKSTVSDVERLALADAYLAEDRPSLSDLAQRFGKSRSAVARALQRARKDMDRAGLVLDV